MAVHNATDCDYFARRVPWQLKNPLDPTSFGLNLGAKVWGIAVTRDSNDIFVGEGLVRIAKIHVRLSAGQLTLKISNHSGTPNFGVPTETRVITSTVDELIIVPLAADKSFISIEGLSGGAGATVEEGGLEVGGVLLLPPDGYEGMHEAQYALTNKVDASYSDLLA